MVLDDFRQPLTLGTNVATVFDMTTAQYVVKQINKKNGRTVKVCSTPSDWLTALNIYKKLIQANGGLKYCIVEV